MGLPILGVSVLRFLVSLTMCRAVGRVVEDLSGQSQRVRCGLLGVKSPLLPAVWPVGQNLQGHYENLPDAGLCICSHLCQAVCLPPQGLPAAGAAHSLQEVLSEGAYT